MSTDTDIAEHEPPTWIVPVPVQRTEYVTREVHVHRAPTDDSVKLLREMEAKAQAQVIKAVQVGDTTFECAVHEYQDAMSDQHVFTAIFSLNGQKMTAEVRRESFKAKREHSQEIFEALAQEMAQEIARAILHRPYLINAQTKWWSR